MNYRVLSIPRWVAIAALAVAVIGGGATGAVAVNKAHAPESAAPSLRSEITSSFAPAVHQALPAVVNISSSKMVKVGDGLSPFSMDPFFRQFFGDRLPQNQTPRQEREHSLGSGVIVKPDGYILTNNHVVDGATEINVSLSDHRELKAKVVGRDSRTDLAVLKVDAKNLPVLAMGDSSQMQPGDLVLAIGSPFGLSQTVTMGIVSATGRGNLGIEDYEDFIQTDAAINPGNSGGALIDTQGRLVGINTAIVSNGGGSQGVGFAVPINMAHKVMDQIVSSGKVTRGYLGAMIQDLTPAMARAFHIPQSGGAVISDVEKGGPAEKAGLKSGDVVVAMDGQPVPSMREFRLKIAMMAPGTTVRLKVLSGGPEHEVAVTLGELPAQIAERGSAQTSGGVLEGLTLEPLTADTARELNLAPSTKGVVITGVDGSSIAAEAGLRRGDVIVEANHRPVSSVAELQRAVSQSAQPVLLLVNRGGSNLFVALEAR